MRWQNTPCIIFPGRKDKQGYGRIWTNGGDKRAHRLAWETKNGSLPSGFQLDHLCRNPSCVNLLHLEPVTSRENTLRGFGPTAINHRKTYCRNGHKLTQENLMPDKYGWRVCRQCKRDRGLSYHHKNNDALNRKRNERRERHKRALELAKKAR